MGMGMKNGGKEIRGSGEGDEGRGQNEMMGEDWMVGGGGRGWREVGIMGERGWE